MTALPDGTYFIAGGAESVADFGLANTPNLSALLYDPSKPRHQRFSVLGSTIVARLYHSEAILLHVGVLPAPSVSRRLILSRMAVFFWLEATQRIM